ncbi:hypothetical protein IID24_05270 [Patescibacteria group bacterium]|nr:hypothetical protein [Patescibacteria group bacterium]
MEILDTVSAIINDPTIQAGLFPAKIIFISLGFFFFAMIIFLLIRSSWWSFVEIDLREGISFRGFGIRKSIQRWRKIAARLDTGSEAEYRLAIGEADELLADSLKRMSVTGETAEERFNNVTSLVIPNIEELRSAHKISNDIGRDFNYKINLREAKRILDIYEQVFLQLDLIQ